MSYAVLTQCLKELGNKSQFIGSKEDMERIVNKYMVPWLWFDAYHFMVHGSWFMVFSNIAHPLKNRLLVGLTNLGQL